MRTGFLTDTAQVFKSLCKIDHGRNMSHCRPRVVLIALLIARFMDCSENIVALVNVQYFASYALRQMAKIKTKKLPYTPLTLFASLLMMRIYYPKLHNMTPFISNVATIIDPQREHGNSASVQVFTVSHDHAQSRDFTAQKQYV